MPYSVSRVNTRAEASAFLKGLLKFVLSRLDRTGRGDTGARDQASNIIYYNTFPLKSPAMHERIIETAALKKTISLASGAHRH